MLFEILGERAQDLSVCTQIGLTLMIGGGEGARGVAFSDLVGLCRAAAVGWFACRSAEGARGWGVR